MSTNIFELQQTVADTERKVAIPMANVTYITDLATDIGTGGGKASVEIGIRGGEPIKAYGSYTVMLRQLQEYHNLQQP